jgi:hypothetical protein
MALTISVPMPPRLAHYVLASALESSYGIGYWNNDYSGRIQYGPAKQHPAPGRLDVTGDYVALHIGAPNKGAECDVPVKHSRIGASRIAAALSAMLADEKQAERAGRVIGGNFDAPDADVVLQFAAFGEVIYG